ncbi:retrovirus-related pol polyprotein from transposon TNT 1-94 [Tanacetum coccineum]|uniref:Retrovirus-related pol polyprotein from transposon TNT 1-94 n=1 Tax=Tanacetum coccineum TaxID=301880 RepID=A0ABQ5CHQ2_9ASTR
MTALADKSLLSGGDNKPLMLEKHLYDSWKSRMELYMMNRPHGRMILASVEKGPLVWPTITDDGITRPKEYTELTPAETIQADCDIKNKVKAHPRTGKSSLKNKNNVIESKGTANVQHSKLNANSKPLCVKCNGCMLSDNHDLCVLDFIKNVMHRENLKSVKKTSKRKVLKSVSANKKEPVNLRDQKFPWFQSRLLMNAVVQIVLLYLDSDCSKHMTGDHSQLTNFVNKFLGTVKFGNDHVEKILGLCFLLYQRNSTSSTNVDQDAPSPSNSQTTPETQSPVIPNDVEEDNHDIEVAHMGNDLYFGVPIPKVPSNQSSSSDSIHTIVQCDHQIFEHNSKWMNDHQLENIIGELARPVSSRLQLLEQALFSMQEELNEFERLKVWELVPRLDKVMVITLKWIYKVKLDELGGILKNEARLLARGYRQEEGIDFEESFALTAFLFEGKLQPKADIDFDELTVMASEQSILGPTLHEMTPAIISSGLVPNPPPSTPVDLPAPEVIAPFDEVVAPVPAVSTGSPSSTNVDQDAPSPSNSQTTPETQPPVIPNDVEENNHDIEVAHIGNDSYFGVPIPKDHPLENIIGALKRPVSTRLQLHEQALFCYYDAFLTVVEPKTYKDALTQSLDLQSEARRTGRNFKQQSSPDGFVDKDNPKHVYKLKKALYGLKQAPRAWYDMLSSFLISQDFSKVSGDPTMFIHKEGKELLLIFQNPRGIFINQSKYALESLKKYGFDSCDPVDTPMVEKSKLDEDKEGKVVDPSHYRGMIGTLLYLTANRPDLQFSICMCARYQARPTKTHLHAVKMIFRYLRGTVNRGLWYPKDSSIALTPFADADHVGCQDTRHSTSGSMHFLGDRLVSWSSKRSKHIDIRFHFIKEHVENGVIELYFVNTEYQLADIFTKPLCRERIEFLINKLGMRSFTPETLKQLADEVAE